MGPEWPSTYVHPKLKLYLVAYVDDFKLCGPTTNLASGWVLLRKGLNIETEQRVGAEGVAFLGCRLERRSVRLKSGRLATVQVYNMQPFLETCVQRYLELAPKGATLKPASTPFINESVLETTAGKPADVGEVAECPWCCHTFKPEIHPDIRALEAAARKQRGSGQAPSGAVPPPRSMTRGRRVDCSRSRAKS